MSLHLEGTVGWGQKPSPDRAEEMGPLLTARLSQRPEAGIHSHVQLGRLPPKTVVGHMSEVGVKKVQA